MGAVYTGAAAIAALFQVQVYFHLAMVGVLTWSSAQNIVLAITYYSTGAWVKGTVCAALAVFCYIGAANELEISVYGPRGVTEIAKKEFMTGKDGEVELAHKYGGQSQKYFKTEIGGRFVDQYSQGIAHESKVGYTTLSKRVRIQILKDAMLIEKKIYRWSSLALF